LQLKQLIPKLVEGFTKSHEEKTMATRTSIKKVRKTEARSVGRKIIEGLEEAIAWSSGKPTQMRVTVVSPPTLDVRQIRVDMGLSQVQFAAKFGFPAATLKNWEQGRAKRRADLEGVKFSRTSASPAA